MFEFENIKFRAVEEEDLRILWEMRRDEEINNALFYHLPISMFTQKQWLDAMLNSKTFKVFMVDRCYDGYTIGCVRLNDINHLHQRVEVGADIIDIYRGEGLGKQLYSALSEYCFDFLNMNRLYLYVFEDNYAVELYKKMGFKIEGILEDYVYKNGCFRNVLLMSKLRKNRVDTKEFEK